MPAVVNTFRQRGSLLDKREMEPRSREISGESSEEAGTRLKFLLENLLEKGQCSSFLDFLEIQPMNMNLAHEYERLTEV
jgi:uncharacterized protein VirK/YbjX